jgi:hypothetical protein
MMQLFAAALVLSSAASPAEAKGSEIPMLLGCTFGAPGSTLLESKESHKLFLLRRPDGGGGEYLSQIDPDSLLDHTIFGQFKITSLDGGELWRFSQSSQPIGTILFVLPKTVRMEDGREARPATLGRYHAGSDPRNGVCVIVRGDDAVSTFSALGSEETAK